MYGQHWYDAQLFGLLIIQHTCANAVVRVIELAQEVVDSDPAEHTYDQWVVNNTHSLCMIGIIYPATPVTSPNRKHHSQNNQEAFFPKHL